MKRLTQWIDHTLLKAEASVDDVRRLCLEAKSFGFFAVCVNPCFVETAKNELQKSGVKIATVIGFPLGANTSATKAFEAEDAIRAGADEIDMVMNIGAAKSGDWKRVEDDIRAVVKASGNHLVKVIIETSLLTREQKVAACLAAKQAGAQFVKTSTGFSTAGATVDDVRLLRETAGPGMGVKASGGMKTKADFEKMIEAGATRLGTSSAVAALSGLNASGSY